MLKQGKEPRGIMGSGTVIGPTFFALHYNEDKAAQGIECRYLPIVFEDLVASPELLPLANIQTIAGGPNNFEPFGSGCLLKEDVARQVEKLWSEHLQSGTDDPEKYGFEGQQRRVFVLQRRRESSLRDAKISQVRQQNGGQLYCQIPRCGFDFSTVYGEVGEGYAQVHHLKPLASADEIRKTTLNDLLVVCANCHAMIHRGGECREPDSLIQRK